MWAIRNGVGLLLALTFTLVPLVGRSAQVEIINRSDVPLQIWMHCNQHRDWAELGASNRRMVSLRVHQSYAFDRHVGGYQIVAVTPNRTQVRSDVKINEPGINRFAVNVAVSAPMYERPKKSYVINRIEDDDEGGDDMNAAADDEEEKPQPTVRVNPDQGQFAANLGITYEPIRYNDGTFGAKLVRDPTPGSPAARMRLETGDTIYELDGTRFRQPQDVLNHRAWTIVRFVNVRTNGAQAMWIYVP
jgi:hypothetical protein